VVGAGLTQLWVAHSILPEPYATLGASGGIFGLLLFYGMTFPQRRVLLIFPPIPMPAWLFVTLYGILELSLGVFGIGPSVAHFAHLGGLATGFALILYWRSTSRQR
jgi:membrane associated rhomboid family serine protease